MAIAPLRGLGDIGIITDREPWDLPPNALSNGSNIRFINGKITKGPVFKGVLNPTATTPVFSYTYMVPGQNDKIGIVNNNGNSYFYTNGVETSTTPAVFTPTTSNQPFTFCVLGGVGYLNRNSDVPQYILPAGTQYTKLANWTATHTCRSLRSFKNFLVAINVTKAGTNSPQMFKWSDVALYNSIPVSWDPADTTKSAGENTLSEATSALVDGMPLRDMFVIYSQNECFMVQYTGDNNVFNFRKLFDTLGAIGTNCVVEVEGKHYVFGKNDIYVHDGTSFDSIAKDKVKDYIFNNLNMASAEQFYVHYNPLMSEIWFCYVSGDSETYFKNTTYPNKAMVFNITNGTWAPRDLPNVSSMTLASTPQSLTWSADTRTWDQATSTWYSLQGQAPKLTFSTSVINTGFGVTASRLVGFDSPYTGYLIPPVTSELNAPSWAYRTGIDFDELGKNIRDYLVIRTIYPQAKEFGNPSILQFQFGASLVPEANITLSTAVTYDPSVDYKVDTMFGGRFLSWKVTDVTPYPFELTGFDFDYSIVGKR